MTHIFLYVAFMIIGVNIGMWIGARIYSARNDEQAQVLFSTGYVRATVDAANAVEPVLRRDSVSLHTATDLRLDILMLEAPNFGAMIKANYGKRTR